MKIKFVKDRPGHDLRYALNSKKIRKKLNWRPKINFNSGLKKLLYGIQIIKNFLVFFQKVNFLKGLG